MFFYVSTFASTLLRSGVQVPGCTEIGPDDLLLLSCIVCDAPPLASTMSVLWQVCEVHSSNYTETEYYCGFIGTTNFLMKLIPDDLSPLVAVWKAFSRLWTAT